VRAYGIRAGGFYCSRMIGLVTYGKYPALTDDDRPLLAELESLGVEAAPVVWDEASVDWTSFDALLLRSPWNYHLKPREFEAWLTELEEIEVPLWNSVAVVRWNMHKRYLRELAGKGVLTPPTEWVARADARPLAALLQQKGWPDAIVKPAISASATDTWRTTTDATADDRRYRALVERGDLLVQPVIPEVEREGEWSLMYLDGRFSHAMLKRPRAGDFRVQAEHGGTAVVGQAPAELVAAADRVVALIPGPWVYARVDGVATDAGFMLMELECIEPVLFLAEAPGSAATLARALAARVG
jgi:glutathione synthase/RimK-type ligase-like ATP-grasp enzyme